MGAIYRGLMTFFFGSACVLATCLGALQAQTIGGERLNSNGTMVPGASFTASSTFAQRPQTIELSWTVPEGVSSVAIQPGIGDVLPDTVNGLGSIVVSPIGRVTYELWVDGAMAGSVVVIGLPEKSKVHLYLCIGQSNMVGAGSVRDPVLDAPVDKVLQFGSRDGMESQWVLAEHRLTDLGSTGNSIGMGLEFAKAMLAYENDPDVVVGLINHAMGSSAIQWWAPGVVDNKQINPQTGENYHLYDEALQRALDAETHGTLKAVLWHQGEYNCGNASDPPSDPDGHAARLQALVSNLRRDFGRPLLPFICGKLVPASWTDEGGQQVFFTGLPNRGIVESALNDLPNHRVNTFSVDNTGLRGHNDNLIHFDAYSQRLLGQRYATALIGLGALRGQTVVADYQDDFQSGSLPDGWQYLWNALGTIEDPQNYLSLQADGTSWDTDASNPGRPDPVPGSNLFLGAFGGHPGSGNPDRYAIAAYTVSESGLYRIEKSFLTLTNSNSGGSADGVEVRVQVNHQPAILTKVVPALETISFDVQLGYLNPGDTIYVAFGENGTHVRDAFEMDFAITQTPSPVVASNLGALDILNLGYPRTFFFRRETVANSASYPNWKANFGRLDGVMMKGQTEELINLTPNVLGYLQTFAVEEPQQMVVLHFNGSGGDPSYFGNALSAGHWLYFPGTGITADIDAADTVIDVSNSAVFDLTVGLGLVKSDELVIVRTDANGNKLWNQAEHVRLTAINGNQITVERNLHGLAPASLDFSAGRAYIAPHAWDGPWGNTTVTNLLWAINYSVGSQLDEQGRNGSAALVDFLVSKFAPGGDMEHFNGIQFDIALWDLRSLQGRVIDSDNDGTGDNGIVNGANAFGKGLHSFYSQLRSALGLYKLILADGGRPESQRAVDVLNGMETEGFSTPNSDPYQKEWSSNMNRFPFWKWAGKQPFELNYAVHKDTSLPVPHPVNLTRMVLAAAQNLGIAVTSLIRPDPEPGEIDGVWDELKRGTDEVYHWLGLPRGDMRRLAVETPDLLGGKGVSLSSDFIAAWSSADASITQNGTTMEIAAQAGASGQLSINLTLASLSPSLSIPSGDLFVRFETRADSLAGFDPNVPRQVKMTVNGRQPSADTADELFGFTGNTDFFESAYYYREAGPSSSIVIHLEFEGIEDVEIRNFTIHSATDVVAREFTHGVVVSNPSLSNYTFDLASLFPGRSFRRIQGSSLQDPVVNDGAAVGNTVVVGPRDGLFLLKTADSTLVDSDNDGLPDEWEFGYAFDLGVLGIAGDPLSLKDSDGDGSHDRDEYGAGTHPLDPADRFTVIDLQAAGDTLRPRWPSVVGRSYRIHYSTNLVHWYRVGAEHPGTGDEITASIPKSFFAGEARVFLRIEAVGAL